MVNLKLLAVANPEDLIKMGFIEDNDGSGDPRGIDWQIKNKNFWLTVDPWFEVKLARIDPDTDFITLHVESLSELEDVVSWIADDEESADNDDNIRI